MIRIAATGVLLAAMSACATTPPPVREVTVTREVPVPFHAPCPGDRSQIPQQPATVASEHPVMPAEGAARETILADKVAEWQTYGGRADAVMRGCAEPR